VLEKQAALNGAAKCEIDLRISRCVYHFSSRILNRRREAGADGVGSRPMWMESYRFTALIVKRGRVFVPSRELCRLRTQRV